MNDPVTRTGRELNYRSITVEPPNDSWGDLFQRAVGDVARAQNYRDVVCDILDSITEIGRILPLAFSQMQKKDPEFQESRSIAVRPKPKDDESAAMRALKDVVHVQTIIKAWGIPVRNSLATYWMSCEDGSLIVNFRRMAEDLWLYFDIYAIPVQHGADEKAIVQYQHGILKDILSWLRSLLT